MYKAVLFALLLLTQTLAQDSVLSQSGDTSAEVEAGGSTDTSVLPQTTSTSTTSFTSSGLRIASLARVSAPTQPSNWNFLKDSSLGDSSKWVSPDGSFAVKPIGYLATYTITFYTDCPQNGVTLYYATTGSSYVQLNGEWILTGDYPFPSTKPHKVLLKQPTLKCGCNVIKVLVYNAWWASPAALIYSLSQDTTGCYNCTNLGVTFYNKNTCQCECASEACDCKNTAKTWFNYPYCGCVCSKSLICAANKYFNRQTCTCDCQPKCCPAGYVQDPSTCECRRQIYCFRVELCKVGYTWDSIACQCVPKCKNVQICPSGQTFNYETCQCECTAVAKCLSPQTWDSDSCTCRCPYLALCINPFTWNSATCSCECQIMCIATMTVDTVNCKCVPIRYPILSVPLTTRISPAIALDSSLTTSGGA